jgi:hypothetical protein
MSRIARFILVLLVLTSPRAAAAADLTLAWDPATDGVTTGYVVFVGTSPGLYARELWVGKVTTYTVQGLTAGATYYFVVRAHDAAGRLSGPSNEASGKPKATGFGGASGSCLTPDPFTILGGGTCVGGNWFPPGMKSPGQPAAPPVPPSAGAPPAPPASPAPDAGACATPDPFTALGGGSCHAGNWFPPGHPGPSAPSSTPAPQAPAVTTAPPAGDHSCATDDPFREIPGLVGLCRAGGWTPWPGISTSATVQLVTDDGYVVLATDDGSVYAMFPAEGPDAAPLQEGTRVFVRALFEPTPATLPADTLLIRVVEIRPE